MRRQVPANQCGGSWRNFDDLDTRSCLFLLYDFKEWEDLDIFFIILPLNGLSG